MKSGSVRYARLTCADAVELVQSGVRLASSTSGGRCSVQPCGISAYSRILLALEVWREMRSVPLAWDGVIWVNFNRVSHPRWWGRNLVDVITHKWQFSSMSAPGDPNLVQWPSDDDPAFDKIRARIDFWTSPQSSSDPTDGAVYYFTPPLVSPPTEWGEVVQTVEMGVAKFYKMVSLT